MIFNFSYLEKSFHVAHGTNSGTFSSFIHSCLGATRFSCLVSGRFRCRSWLKNYLCAMYQGIVRAVTTIFVALTWLRTFRKEWFPYRQEKQSLFLATIFALSVGVLSRNTRQRHSGWLALHTIQFGFTWLGLVSVSFEDALELPAGCSVNRSVKTGHGYNLKSGDSLFVGSRQRVFCRLAGTFGGAFGMTTCSNLR